MADRDITVDVKIRADTKGSKEAAAALGDIDKAADDAGKSMSGMEGDAKALGAEVDKTTDSVEGLAEETDKATAKQKGWKQSTKDAEEAARAAARRTDAYEASLKSLEARIETTKTRIQELGSEFARTGAATTSKQLNDQRSLLSTLTRLRKELDVPQLGKLPSLDLGAIAGLAKPALIGVAVAVAPAIAGIIGGAVVGGVGLGGIAGGVFAAAHDSRVQAAWQDFTKTLTAKSFGADTFVGPVIEGIDILKKGVADLHLGDVLGGGANAVPKLADGLVRFAKGVMPGVIEVMGHADQIAGVFEKGLGEVGSALGDVIVDLANSRGSIEGLVAVFGAADDAIRVFGGTISWLANRYDDLSGVSQALAPAEIKAWGWMPVLGDWMRDHKQSLDDAAVAADNHHRAVIGAGTATHAFVDVVHDANGELVIMAESLDQIFAGELGVDQATLAWKEDVLGLTEAVKDHGTTLADNTEDGLANQRMLQGLVGDAMSMREATLKATGSVSEANQKYNDQIAALYELGKKLGFTKEQLDKIAGKYEIAVVTTYTTVGSLSQINKNLRLEDRFEGRADGGGVMAGVPYMINERGRETVTFGASGTVHPAHLSPVVSGSGPLDIRLTWAPTGQRLVDALMEALRPEIQGRGGPVAAFR